MICPSINIHFHIILSDQKRPRLKTKIDRHTDDKMALEGEAAKINTELTKNAVEIRQIIQDFPLCSTFKEIDEQNGLGTDI